MLIQSDTNLSQEGHVKLGDDNILLRHDENKGRPNGNSHGRPLDSSSFESRLRARAIDERENAYATWHRKIPSTRGRCLLKLRESCETLLMLLRGRLAPL